MRSTHRLLRAVALAALLLALSPVAPPVAAEQTAKPILHGRHWIAITGKPLGATAGARIFVEGGNAVDAACAMLAATSTMWDVLSWGGETQALVWHPGEERVIGVNALGVAPSGATAELFRGKGMAHPPQYGPLAAVTPGTPGGLMTMLAEWGTLSLGQVLAPAIEMADGYPIEAQAAEAIERHRERIEQWEASRRVFLPELGGVRRPPRPGEVFRQPELAATLRKLVEAEERALAAGKSREEAIRAASDRFYRGDVAAALVEGFAAEGGMITLEDLDAWRVRLEEPVSVDYDGIEVYKLTTWTQGPVMLQMLNMVEGLDLEAMGYNSARYVHTLYQVMNHAFADRDFYYGDPYFPPEEPIEGLLSEEYAAARRAGLAPEANDPDVQPGDPYPFQGGENPFEELRRAWHTVRGGEGETDMSWQQSAAKLDADFTLGTTTIQAADADGWVVSVTPSGGWIPAVVAGDTGVGMSQRAQSFVVDPADNPYNVVEPGKRPRATLTPGMAIRDGRPFLSFAVQGGDSQDQNLLQFFLDVVVWGMDVQRAAEAAHFNSYQMRASFGDHESRPGRLLLHEETPPWVRAELEEMGYDLVFRPRTSGPVNAIFFDAENGTFQGGSSHFGEDYGIAW